MNDDRIEVLLRAGPPDEPARGALPRPDRGAAADGTDTAVAGRRRSMGALRLLPAAILSLVMVAAAGALLPAGRPDASPGLPARVIEAGVLRLGVTDGAPQLRIGASVQGFDVDVATAIGKRLGIGVQVVAAEPAQLLAADPPLDALLLALPPGVDRAAARPGTPYLWRPGAVVAASTDPIRAAADLEGRTACAVAGGTAEAWLAGALPPGADAMPAPRVRLETRDTLDACLVAVQASPGWVAVADRAYDTLALPAGLEVAPFTPFAVPSTPWVSATTPDADRILAALDAALAGLRADGTLARLSRHRFAGLDLTNRP